MKNTVAKKRTDPENVQAGINSGKKKRGQEPQRVKAAIGDSQRCKNTHALCRPSYHNSNHHGHKKQQQQQPQGSRKKRSESGGKNGSWKAGKKLTSGHTNARWCRKKTRKEKKKKERKKEKKTPPLERQASSSLSPLSSLLAFSLSPPRDRTKRAPKHHPAQSKLPMSAPTKTRPKKTPATSSLSPPRHKMERRSEGERDETTRAAHKSHKHDSHGQGCKTKQSHHAANTLMSQRRTSTLKRVGECNKASPHHSPCEKKKDTEAGLRWRRGLAASRHRRHKGRALNNKSSGKPYKCSCCPCWQNQSPRLPKIPQPTPISFCSFAAGGREGKGEEPGCQQSKGETRQTREEQGLWCW